MFIRILFFSLILLISASTHAQSRSELLEKRVTIQMAQKPLFTVFARLTIDYDIPIGLEESLRDADHGHYYFETGMPSETWGAKHSGREHRSGAPSFDEHLISVDLVDASLKDVMDEIVKQLKFYDWEVRDEVVNIFPIQGRDRRLKKLLDSEISQFIAGAGTKTGTVQTQLLLFLPEVKRFLKDCNLEADTTRVWPGFPETVIAKDLVFQKMECRAVLNAITKVKRGGWILRLSKNSGEPNKELINLQID
jgi:hypothetical protein